MDQLYLAFQGLFVFKPHSVLTRRQRFSVEGVHLIPGRDCEFRFWRLLCLGVGDGCPVIGKKLLQRF